jgi:hypothetical protein
LRRSEAEVAQQTFEDDSEPDVDERLAQQTGESMVVDPVDARLDFAMQADNPQAQDINAKSADLLESSSDRDGTALDKDDEAGAQQEREDSPEEGEIDEIREQQEELRNLFGPKYASLGRRNEIHCRNTPIVRQCVQMIRAKMVRRVDRGRWLTKVR